MVKKLKDLEDLKLAAAKDSMGGAAAGECGRGSYLLHLVSVLQALTYCVCVLEIQVDNNDCISVGLYIAMLTELQSKIESLQTELSTVKVSYAPSINYTLRMMHTVTASLLSRSHLLNTY